MSAPANTASKAAGELAVPIADQEPEPGSAIAEFHQQVADLLGGPGVGIEAGVLDSQVVLVDARREISG
jgi:hypothetical protein